MNLVADLVADASGTSKPVSALLRQAKVIAHRLKVVELETWVEHEIGGYPASSELPSYRGPFDSEVLGTLAGPFGSGMQNAPIPKAAFPDDLREGFLFKHAYLESVTELEALSQSPDDLRSPWPADVLAYTNSLIQDGKINLYGGLYLQGAWRIISKTHLMGVVDAVRNRVLDLALTLEELDLQSLDANADVPPATVTHIVNNIYGSTNVAIASSHVTQTVVTSVPQGDKNALLDALRSHDLADTLIAELEEALSDDAANSDGQATGPGPRVQAWMGRIALGAGGVMVGAGGDVVGSLIRSYFGM